MRGAFTTRACFTGALLFSVLATSGCFDAPPIEDRWTRLDLRSVEWVDSSEGRVLEVRGEVTYRAILTGAVAAELRRSPQFGRDALHFDDDDDRRLMAADVALLLDSSEVIAGDAREVTGWDHLIQGFDFRFPASAADTSGSFVVFYLGDGERAEVEGGGDTLVVTPWASEDHEVLPTARWVAP